MQFVFGFLAACRVICLSRVLVLWWRAQTFGVESRFVYNLCLKRYVSVIHVNLMNRWGLHLLDSSTINLMKLKYFRRKLYLIRYLLLRECINIYLRHKHDINTLVTDTTVSITRRGLNSVRCIFPRIQRPMSMKSKSMIIWAVIQLWKGNSGKPGKMKLWLKEY